MPKVKEKTFWVYRGIVCHLASIKKSHVLKHEKTWALGEPIISLLPIMQYRELKQFKIVEVKRERP